MIRRGRSHGFTLIELMIVVAIIGILAAIAIPNLMRFQARSRQGEAKANLKAIFIAQRAFYQEKDRFTPYLRELGFAPERANRYYYQVGAGNTEDRSKLPADIHPDDTAITVDGAKFPTSPLTPAFRSNAITFIPPTAGGAIPPVTAPGGVNGFCPQCEFSAFATGNIDNELIGNDSWYIASIDSSFVPVGSTLTENVVAGQPNNTYNDVDNDS